MTKVMVKNGNFEGAYKKFKNDQAKNGTLSEFKTREQNIKPGSARR